MKRLTWISLLLYSLFFVGMATVQGEILALMLPLLLYLWMGRRHRPGAAVFAVTRTLSALSATQGSPVEVTVTLRNQGPRLEEVLACDVAPRGLKVIGGAARGVAALSPGEALTVRYTVQAQRGSYVFSAVQVRVGETLGLFSREMTLEADAHLMVYPRVLPLHSVAIRPRRTRAQAGPIPARQGGTGVDFFGVREYQMGDPLRWVNWRAGARHPQRLFTNEFEQERIADVGLILDARRQSNAALGGKSLFEHAVQATASLADVFLGDGNRVALLIYGVGVQRTSPGYGKVQRERILRSLSTAQTGDSQIFDSLDYLPIQFFPAQSQLVIISPLLPDDLATLRRLRARGYEVLVVSPDPVAYEAHLRWHTAQPPETSALRLARIERALLLRDVRRLGVRLVNWDVYQTPAMAYAEPTASPPALDQALRAAFTRTVRR